VNPIFSPNHFFWQQPQLIRNMFIISSTGHLQLMLFRQR